MLRRSALVLIVAVLMIACMLSTGAMAKEKVVLWSFAANNIAEWEAREADIEAKFNIDLVIEQVAQNAFVETLQAAMMDGTGPDIIEWMIEENRILNADPKQCIVVPLDKYVEKSEVFKNVVPGRVAWVTYGGHVYGLPHDVHPCVLVYNDDLWKSVGVDLATIETWDEFFAAAVKLAEKKQDGRPVHYALPHIASGLNGTMFMIQQQAGAQVLDENGMPILENAEFKAFVEKWLEWVNLGVMCEWDWGNFGSLFANGTMAAYASPDWYLAQADEAAQKYNIKVRPLPVYKAGGPRTASWGGTFMAITKAAKNPDLLYPVIEYMQYDESAIKVRFEETDMLPPFAGVWDSELFQQPDPRFGGQKVGQLLAEMAKEMPSVNTGDLFWDVVIHDFSTQYTEMAAGRITVDEGLRRAQEAAMRRLR
ncbi:MAG: carbohydrate ABC transporter substrate-binding protein [Firmicutes bacterium]|nr:carbohydrate ABC transporter substrate-binding protein [Bacillota bacterium]